MRYWWVNQNQTYRHEVAGGYLWSPRRKSNGNRNPFYDFMREVSPGDVVFSFADTLIKAIGIAGSHAYEAPKPLEFAGAGAYWDLIGWRVDVHFHPLAGAIKPSSHMASLVPHLQKTYAPLRSNGAGLQSVYLTYVSPSFAAALVDLVGREARDIVSGVRVSDANRIQPAIGLIEWEEHVLAGLHDDRRLTDTERSSVVMTRRSQVLFKDRVMQIEKVCRITGVDQQQHLRASHCKPWRESSNEERLDGENGLLLSPNADHLFDRGFIGFGDDGELLISPVAHCDSLRKLGIAVGERINVGRFTSGQRSYLDFHRENVLLKSPFPIHGVEHSLP